MTGSVDTSYLPPSMLTSGGQVKPEFQDVAAQVAAGIQAKAESLPPAQRAVFLGIIQSPSLGPTAGDFKSNPDAALDRAGEASARLTALFESLDSGDVLGKLMIEIAQMQRKDALESRLMAREQAKGQMMDQAGDMREAAAKIMTGAIISLVVTVVASLVTIAASVGNTASGLKGISGQKQALDGQKMASQGQTQQSYRGATDAQKTEGMKLESQGYDLNKKGLDGQAVSMKQQLKADLISQLGQIIQGFGNMMDSNFQSQAKVEEAEGQEHAAQAEHAKGEADIARDTQQQLDEFINKLIEFLKNLNETEVNQMAAVTRG
jgi:hypothetical protein